jgi:hypothetical protein
MVLLEEAETRQRLKRVLQKNRVGDPTVTHSMKKNYGYT